MNSNVMFTQVPIEVQNPVNNFEHSDQRTKIGQQNGGLWLSIPDDIMSLIFSKVGVVTSGKILQTSKYYNNNQRLWKDLCYQETPGLRNLYPELDKLRDKINWKMMGFLVFSDENKMTSEDQYRLEYEIRLISHSIFVDLNNVVFCDSEIMDFNKISKEKINMMIKKSLILKCEHKDLKFEDIFKYYGLRDGIKIDKNAIIKCTGKFNLDEFYLTTYGPRVEMKGKITIYKLPNDQLKKNLCVPQDCPLEVEDDGSRCECILF